jgi:hypothetical protein
MSCRKTDNGVNDFNPDIVSGLKVKECVMGEARRTQGRDENEALSSNREANKPTDNITVTVLWFCRKHFTDVSVQIKLATYNLGDSCHHICSAKLQTLVHT